MSILKEKKSCSEIGSDARVEVVDRSQEHSGKFSGKDVFAKNGGEQQEKTQTELLDGFRSYNNT